MNYPAKSLQLFQIGESHKRNGMRIYFRENLKERKFACFTYRTYNEQNQPI